MYLCDKNQPEAIYFSIYFNNYPLHVSCSNFIVLAASQRGCMINAIYCMYSELPSEDEQLVYSKRVEDIY
jgi:hypothetical protein